MKDSVFVKDLILRKSSVKAVTLVNVILGAHLKVNKYISIQHYSTGDSINKNPNSAFLILTYSYI